MTVVPRKLLVYHPHGRKPTVWDCTTKGRKTAALFAVFHRCDERGIFAELESYPGADSHEVRLYHGAKAGNPVSLEILMTSWSAQDPPEWWFTDLINASQE
jgi:hypothetical protein